MTVCPKCRVELAREPDALLCPKCHSRYPAVDGAVAFADPTGDADYDPADFERLAAVEADHFWFRARNRVIVALFEQYVGRSARIIEVGAGTGVVAAALAEAGFRVAVGDVFPAALEHCRRHGLGERYQFDIRRPPFRDEFDCVGLFDVLEHLDDDRAVLSRVGEMLRGRGKVVVTVPAHRWLWSRSDVEARHKRRYSLAGLRRLFEDSGFDVIHAGGFFLSLLPGLLARRVLFPAGRPSRHGLAVPVANDLFLGILTLEHDLSRRLKPSLGASLALVAQLR